MSKQLEWVRANGRPGAEVSMDDTGYWMVEGRTLYRRDLGHEWTPVATVSKPRALAQKISDAIEEALIESLLEPTHD